MEIITHAIAGIVVGWICYAWLKINLPRGLIFSLTIGIAGGVLGGALLVPLIETVPVGPDGIDLLAIATACSTAVAALIIADMSQRRLGDSGNYRP
jgi:uncharacterized membrane protein YeaQ/YmgE (transglycosylase-associated protein family)